MCLLETKEGGKLCQRRRINKPTAGHSLAMVHAPPVRAFRRKIIRSNFRLQTCQRPHSLFKTDMCVVQASPRKRCHKCDTMLGSAERRLVIACEPHNTSSPSSASRNFSPPSTSIPHLTHSVPATLSSGHLLLARLSRPSVTSIAPSRPASLNLLSLPS